MQISARWVLPVTSVRRLRSSRSSSHGRGAAPSSGLRDLGERDLELVEAVVARLVDARRLAGRPDEQAGEEIAQARAPQPVDDEALEQVGAPEERAVERRRAADHDMVAAAGPGMLAVDHELVGAEPRMAAPPRRPLRWWRRIRASSTQGWMLTSITPGSGATRMTLRRGSTGGG